APVRVDRSRRARHRLTVASTSTNASSAGQTFGSGWSTLITAWITDRKAKNPRNPMNASSWRALRLCSDWSWGSFVLMTDSLGLHATRGQAGDDASLEDEHHDDQRDGDQGAGRHHR